MINSIIKNKKGIILMLISSICICVGQLFWKLSDSKSMMFIILGFLLYGIGASSMIIAYRYGKLSILQPILCLNYILAIILAVAFLGEIISPLKCIGVLLIFTGVILIAGGDEE